MDIDTKQIQMERGFRVSIRTDSFEAVVRPDALFQALEKQNAFSDNEKALHGRTARAISFRKLFPWEEQCLNVSSIATYIATQAFGMANSSGPVLEMPLLRAKQLLLHHLFLDKPHLESLDCPDMVLVTVPLNNSPFREHFAPTVADVLYGLEIARPLEGPLCEPVRDALDTYWEVLSWTADGEKRRGAKAQFPGRDNWQAVGECPFIETMQAIAPSGCSPDLVLKWTAAMTAIKQAQPI